ncbi:MAG: hypothetical protein HY801_03865 [Candidatus Lindowbacteria bacterium]|nr:hypothetical protein [Candidatus Lindowbacteria bacterium]
MSGDADTQQDFFYEKGWTDGLPIIPPTPEKVRAMLVTVDRGPQESLGPLPPLWGEATIQKIAANAVMAGCLPSYFPVVAAAVEAMLEEKFNLYGVQATTHPASPLVIVNGPIARELGINCKGNCFGQGWRANAAIGRAVRLVMQNIGGGIPGELDKATMGHPGKYAYCIAENEAESPWEPFHVERGFDPAVSAVTVVAAEAPRNINDHGSTTAQGVLTTICGSIAAAGTNNLYRVSDLFVVIGPEHAATIAAGGFSKKAVREYIFEHARVPISKMSKEQLTHIQAGRPDDFVESDGAMLVAPTAGDFNVIVAGGPGKHSMWIPTFISYSVTKAVCLKGA